MAERVVTPKQRLYVSEVRNGKIKIGFWDHPPYLELQIDVATAKALIDKLSGVLWVDEMSR